MTKKSLSIADLQAQGFAGFFVTCMDPMCLYSTPVSFECLALDPAVSVSEIGDMRRFECASCGSLKVSTPSEWRDHNAHGNAPVASIVSAGQPRLAEDAARTSPGAVADAAKRKIPVIRNPGVDRLRKYG